MPKIIKINIPAYGEGIMGDGVLELSEQCWFCKHFNAEFNSDEKINCAAFNSGIPEEILAGKHDHTKPYKGDGGITFEPIEE
jgi:hypothetical protein